MKSNRIKSNEIELVVLPETFARNLFDLLAKARAKQLMQDLIHLLTLIKMISHIYIYIYIYISGSELTNESINYLLPEDCFFLLHGATHVVIEHGKPKNVTRTKNSFFWFDRIFFIFHFSFSFFFFFSQQ